ncbi:hypothetical protein [Rhodococcus koreensis]
MEGADVILTGRNPDRPAVARNAANTMRPAGTPLLMGGTGGRRIGHGLGNASAATAALPPFTAALAVHIMSNTALTGATYDIDGGQQFVSDDRTTTHAAIRTTCSIDPRHIARGNP